MGNDNEMRDRIYQYFNDKCYVHYKNENEKFLLVTNNDYEKIDMRNINPKLLRMKQNPILQLFTEISIYISDPPCYGGNLIIDTNSNLNKIMWEDLSPLIINLSLFKFIAKSMELFLMMDKPCDFPHYAISISLQYDFKIPSEDTLEQIKLLLNMNKIIINDHFKYTNSVINIYIPINTEITQESIELLTYLFFNKYYNSEAILNKYSLAIEEARAMSKLEVFVS